MDGGDDRVDGGRSSIADVLGGYLATHVTVMLLVGLICASRGGLRTSQ